jgi:hypothetical protein
VLDAIFVPFVFQLFDPPPPAFATFGGLGITLAEP